MIHLAKWHQQVHCGTNVIVMKLYLTQPSIVEQWTPSRPWKYIIGHFQCLSSFKYNNLQFYSSPEFFLVWDSLEFNPAFGGKHTSPLVNLCQGFRPLLLSFLLSFTDGVPQPGKLSQWSHSGTHSGTDNSLAPPSIRDLHIISIYLRKLCSIDVKCSWSMCINLWWKMCQMHNNLEN